MAEKQLIQSHKDLKVWQEAMNLAEECYRLTKLFPGAEIYGMTSQIRRSAVSVPANIAEGYGREHRQEYIHFLRYAQGSLKELETHLILSGRVGLTTKTQTDPLLKQCDAVGRMLHALIRSLQHLSS
jgi:four helix bundle protein